MSIKWFLYFSHLLLLSILTTSNVFGARPRFPVVGNRLREEIEDEERNAICCARKLKCCRRSDQEPDIEVRAVMMRCPLSGHTENAKQREQLSENNNNNYPDFDEDEGPAEVHVQNCSRKLMITMRIDNKRYISRKSQFVIIDHVYDPMTEKNQRLLNPYVIKLRQDHVTQLYEMKFLNYVNAEAKEVVLNKHMSNYTGCRTSGAHPTCGLVTYKGKMVPFSAGFCCSCDTLVNNRRQPKVVGQDETPAVPSSLYGSEYPDDNVPIKVHIKPDSIHVGESQQRHPENNSQQKPAEESSGAYNNSQLSRQNQFRANFNLPYLQDISTVDVLMLRSPPQKKNHTLNLVEEEKIIKNLEKDPAMQRVMNSTVKLQEKYNDFHEDECVFLSNTSCPRIRFNAERKMTPKRKSRVKPLHAMLEMPHDNSEDDIRIIYDNVVNSDRASKSEPLMPNPQKILDIIYKGPPETDENDQRYLKKQRPFPGDVKRGGVSTNWKRKPKIDSKRRRHKKKQSKFNLEQGDLGSYRKNMHNVHYKRRHPTNVHFEDRSNKRRNKRSENLKGTDFFKSTAEVNLDKRQISSGGSQIRGGQNCANRYTPPGMDPETYHESTHCLRFSEIWYAVYQLHEPIVEHSLHIQIFEKHEDARGKIVWRDLTQGRVAHLSSLTPSFEDATNTISINYYSKDNMKSLSNTFALNYRNARLLIPEGIDEENISKYPEVNGGPGEYLVVHPDLIATDGDKCNSAGVSFEAFFKQPNRCSVRRGSCLANQPRHLWKHDHKAEKLQRKGCFFLKHFGMLPEKPIHRNGSEQLYLSLHHDGAFATMLDMEISADSNTALRASSTAITTEVYVDSTNPVKTMMTVKVMNAGLISSNFHIKLSDCPIDAPSSFNEIETKPVLIAPQHQYVFNLEMLGKLPPDIIHCSVEVMNADDELVALRRIKIQKSDRCVCTWYCLCACIGTSEGLKCKPMASEQYHATGFMGTLPMLTSAIENRVICDTFDMLSLILIFMLMTLLFLGLTKAVIGLCCCRPVGMWGLPILLDLPKRMTRYYERSLQQYAVVYDDSDWPISPVNHKRVRNISRTMEFCTNVLFFFTYPFAVLLLLIKRLCCPYYTFENASTQPSGNQDDDNETTYRKSSYELWSTKSVNIKVGDPPTTKSSKNTSTDTRSSESKALKDCSGPVDCNVRCSDSEQLKKTCVYEVNYPLFNFQEPVTPVEKPSRKRDKTTTTKLKNITDVTSSQTDPPSLKTDYTSHEQSLVHETVHIENPEPVTPIDNNTKKRSGLSYFRLLDNAPGYTAERYKSTKRPSSLHSTSVRQRHSHITSESSEGSDG